MTKKEMEEQLKRLQAELAKLNDDGAEYPEEGTKYYFIGGEFMPFDEGCETSYIRNCITDKQNFLYGNFHETEQDRHRYRAFMVGASVFWQTYKKEDYSTEDACDTLLISPLRLGGSFLDLGKKKIKEVEEILASE